MRWRSGMRTTDIRVMSNLGIRTVRGVTVEMWRELVVSRDLLRAFVARDLLVRYRQALLGVGWTVLSPLLNVLVFSLIFTRVAPIDTGVPYPVYVYAGLWPWTFFAASLRGATVSLSGNASLVTKVYFAREVLPFSVVLVALVDFAVAGALLAMLMLWYQVPVGIAALFLPIIVLVHVLFTTGLALLLSVANLYWRDTRHVIEAILTVWMFATSVVYPVERVGGRIGTVLALNPMTPIIDAYRDVLLYGRMPQPAPFAYAALVALVVFVVAWYRFHRSELQFAERA